ncbi:MAG: hypothetical protein MHM6MM_004635 [Cercozoa sp. M6MM]
MLPLFSKMVHCGCYLLTPQPVDSSVKPGPVYLPQVKAQVRSRLVDNFACEVKLSLTFNYDEQTHHIINERMAPFAGQEDVPLPRLSYAIPLDENAAVCEFEADIGGRRIRGEVQEKKQARATFEAALKEGKRTALLERDPSNPDTFVIELGAPPSGSNSMIEISLTYVAELRFSGDDVVFELPTAVAPLRRILGTKDAPTTGHVGSMPFNELGRQTAGTSMLFDFELLAQTSSTVLDIVADGAFQDKITIDREAEGGPKITCTDAQFGGFEPGNRVLSLRILFEESMSQGVVEYSPEHQSVASRVSLSARKLDLEDALELPCELIFLVDISGSMMGQPIEAVKLTLQIFLRSLPENAMFNIIAFDTRIESCFSVSQSLTPENLKTAEGFVAWLHARGGTDILQPLNHVFKQRVKPEYPRQIFLLTDGQVSNRDRCIKAVAENNTNQRLFAFGLGGGADRVLVRGLAGAGRGTAAFIASPSEAGDSVMTMLVTALQPALTHLSLEYPDKLKPTMRVPATVPSTLFPGTEQSTQCLYALREGVSAEEWQQLTSEESTSKCVLTGALAIPNEEVEGSLSTPVRCEMPIGGSHKHMAVGNTIHRLLARRRIKELEDTGNTDTDTVGEIAGLGVKYQLVSSQTSFVAVDEDNGEEIDDIHMAEQVRQEMEQTRREKERRSHPRKMMSRAAPRRRRKMDKGGAPPMLMKSMAAPCAMASPPPPPGGIAFGGMPQAAPAVQGIGGGGNGPVAFASAAAPMPSRRMAAPMALRSKSSASFSAPRGPGATGGKQVEFSKNTTLNALVSAQQMDGSWTLDSLSAALQAHVATVQSQLSVSDAASGLIGTLLALAALQKYCAAEKMQWTVLAGKGRRYLLQQFKTAVGGTKKQLKSLVDAIAAALPKSL